jgi:hypothetical protein
MKRRTIRALAAAGALLPGRFHGAGNDHDRRQRAEDRPLAGGAAITN